MESMVDGRGCVTHMNLGGEKGREERRRERLPGRVPSYRLIHLAITVLLFLLPSLSLSFFPFPFSARSFFTFSLSPLFLPLEFGQFRNFRTILGGLIGGKMNFAG